MEDVPENDKEQEPSQVFGKCVKCNFVNSSGVFVCSVCGYTFDPEPKSREQNDDVIEELDDDQETTEENLSEIIRCPQCNEINMYNRGTCWHCGLQFEIGEIA
jgi:rubredoxin